MGVVSSAVAHLFAQLWLVSNHSHCRHRQGCEDEEDYGNEAQCEVCTRPTRDTAIVEPHLQVGLCVCVCVYECMCMHVFVCARVCARVRACTYVCVCAGRGSSWLCLHTCTCTMQTLVKHLVALITTVCCPSCWATIHIDYLAPAKASCWPIIPAMP